MSATPATCPFWFNAFRIFIKVARIPPAGPALDPRELIYMHAFSFSRNTLVIICFLSFAFAVQAQTAPKFSPGQQVASFASSSKAVSADVNHDGFADMITLEPNATTTNVVIYLGNGDGTFQAPFSVFDAPGLNYLALADFNQDGNLDIAVAGSTGAFDNTGAGTVSFIFGNGQGSFGGPQTFQSGPVGGIAAGDFDNDGLTDLAALGEFSKSVTIFHNTGGAFTTSTFTVPTNFDMIDPTSGADFLSSLVAGDFNGDGKMDLVYQDSCSGSCPVSEQAYYLLTNTGNGFTATLTNIGSTGANELHVADLDGDGRADFFFAFHGCHTPCFGVDAAFSNGDGTFQSASVFNGDNGVGGDPLDVIAGDFNNDGIMDIVAAVSPNDATINPGMDIYSGKGGRAFAAATHFDSPHGANGTPFRVAAGFINHDGQKDIVMVEGGDFIPWLNITGTAHSPCAAPASPGLNFCLPANGGTVNSPVRFVGSFHAQTQPANRIELWIDGAKKFQVFNDIIDVSLAVGLGTHTATLVGVSAAGPVINASHTFTVQAGCPVPATATVSICSPAAGSTVASPVHITAAARAPSGRTITAMRIYIDNVAQQTVSGNTITADLTVPAGSHLLAVVGYDNTGAAEKTTENFTVSGGATGGPCLPSAPGIKICTPASGASVTSPVEVSAGAVPTAQRITAIRVYLDNVAVFFSSNSGTANSFSIDQKLTMAAGTHNLVVVAYQNNGTALTAGENITVH